MLIDLALIGILALLLDGVLGAALARSARGGSVVYGLALLLTAGLAALGAAALLGGLAGGAQEAVLPVGLPWLQTHLRLDALAAFFLLTVNLAGAAISLFALGYGRQEHRPGHESGPVLPLYPLFLAGMDIVLLADDAFVFLVAWEFMSLTSWLLVLSRHREAGNPRAAYVYLVMATFGTLALMLAFGLLAGPAGDYTFAAMRAAQPGGWIATLVLALALAGAGSKAGMAPLHVWLPLAHPAAPSQVSALMSGAMTKVALYGLIRLVFELLGDPLWWWGLAFLILGAGTALLGVLQAVLQTELKRLLAYSTVENIGIVLVALGLALAFHADVMHEAAALALTAALFHIFNHALFKSLLFCGAGAVLAATGEHSIDRLGGLIHRMPVTAAVWLAGAAAISALPPLNGFVSEWLLLQAILLSPELPQWALRLALPGIGAMVALAAALAATCFVRAYGIVFLGRPRSAAAAGAAETDALSRAAMIALAAACLLAGVLPMAVITLIDPVTVLLLGTGLGQLGGTDWLWLAPVGEARSSYGGVVLLAMALLLGLLVALVVRRGAVREVRRGPAWDCGFPEGSPAGQYSGASFAQPIRRIFGLVFLARETVDMPDPGETRPARHAVVLHDLVWELYYLPVVRLVQVVSERLDALRFFTIRRYLGLMFGVLVLLLTVIVLWR